MFFLLKNNMLKYNPQTLKNIEEIFKTAGYTVRFGKGQFATASCLIQQKKVVVINRYHPVDAQINALIDILNQLPTATFDTLPEKMLKDYKNYIKVAPQ